MSRHSTIRLRAALLGGLGAALMIASPAHALTVAECTAQSTADWTAGADQYTTTYRDMLAFPTTLPAQTANSWAKPERPKRMTRTARAQYNAAVTAWKAQLAKDERANQRVAKRAIEDLERLYQRAKDDVEENATNRSNTVDVAYNREYAKLNNCQEILDTYANADYGNKSDALTANMQNAANAAQGAYLQAVSAAQSTFDTSMEPLDDGPDYTACQKGYNKQPVPKVKAKKGTKKYKAEKKASEKAQKSNAKEKTEYDACKREEKADHADDVRDASTALNSALGAADLALSQATAAAEQEFNANLNKLELDFTIGGIQRTYSFEAASTDLTVKRDTVQGRSARQLTEEQRALEDAYVLCQRTIEDRFGVEL